MSVRTRAQAGPSVIAERWKAMMQKKAIKENLELYLIFLPVMLHILIFCYIPLYGVVIAFQDYSPGKPFLAFDGSVAWVGLKHFATFITNPYFWRLIRNTLVMSALNLGVGFWVPILFALLLNELTNAKYKKFIQTASYLPHFISAVVVAGMVLSFINSEGIINQLRMMAGASSLALNIEPKYFPFIYTITNIWKSFGWGSILYLSSMSSIDVALYEAARLDGANRLKQIFYVTLPSIKPTIVMMFIFAVGGMLNADSEMILLLYNPATYETADVIGTYLYREGLLGGQFSYGSAVGIFTSAINFTLVFLANTVSRKVSDYSLW